MIHFKVSADPVTEIGVQYYDICFHFKGDKSITIFHRDSPSIHDAIILHVPATIEVKQPQTWYENDPIGMLSKPRRRKPSASKVQGQHWWRMTCCPTSADCCLFLLLKATASGSEAINTTCTVIGALWPTKQCPLSHTLHNVDWTTFITVFVDEIACCGICFTAHLLL